MASVKSCIFGNVLAAMGYLLVANGVLHGGNVVFSGLCL